MLLFTISGIIAVWGFRLCGGHFVYPLDDAYIGMALAKNFATHGTWGITQYQFSSATSSPLFVLVLAAAYKVLGVSQYSPAILSILCSGLCLVVVDRFFPRDLTTNQRFVALVAVLAFAPLHVLGLLGMEHSLHTLLTLLFLRLSADLVLHDHWSRWLWLLLPCMVAVRNESLFLVAPCAASLALQHRWKRAWWLALWSGAPVVGIGLLSHLKGWYWLPNSIAMKGLSARHLSLTGFLTHFVDNVGEAPALMMLLVSLAVVARALPQDRAQLRYFAFLVSIAIALHLLLADTGWVYRYEAYLIVSATVTLALAVRPLRAAMRLQPSLRLALVLPAVFLGVRCATATIHLPAYDRLIYSQQYQMAQFVRRYYNGASVAANDIGAINFFADIDCLDLTGLADREIFYAKRSQRYSTATIDALTQRHAVNIAMIYDSWFSLEPVSVFGGPPVPAKWVRVARWKLPSQGHLGGDTVSFYAVQTREQEHLQRSLSEFASNLPGWVAVVPN